MADWKLNYQSPDEVVKVVRSGYRVFVHGSAATPLFLLKTLLKRGPVLKNVELVSIRTLGDAIFQIQKEYYSTL